MPVDAWFIEQLSFKPWPSCRGTHAAIEAALQVRGEAGFDAAAIERVTLDVGVVQQMLAEPLDRKRAPRTAIDAKFSLPFTVATALVHGEVTLDHFSPAALTDARVLALARRIGVRQRPDWGRDQAAAGGLTLEQRGRPARSVQILDALGSPNRPLSPAQRLAKFHDCTSRAAVPLSRGASEALAGVILSLECQADLAGLSVPT